jgi:hypothetical protein
VTPNYSKGRKDSWLIVIRNEKEIVYSKKVMLTKEVVLNVVLKEGIHDMHILNDTYFGIDRKTLIK